VTHIREIVCDKSKKSLKNREECVRWKLLVYFSEIDFRAFWYSQSFLLKYTTYSLHTNYIDTTY